VIPGQALKYRVAGGDKYVLIPGVDVLDDGGKWVYNPRHPRLGQGDWVWSPKPL